MKLLGAGVDLMSLSRVRKFLDQHSSKRIFRLFSPAEKKRYQKRKISALLFAKMFAAKEAFFKTLGMPWMGLEGFASMEMTPSPGGRFSIRVVKGNLAGKIPYEAEGCFFRSGNLLGAQVLRWETGVRGASKT